MSVQRGPEVFLVHWCGMPIDCARITTTKMRADEIIKQGGGEDIGTIYHLVDIETARALEKERDAALKRVRDLETAARHVLIDHAPVTKHESGAHECGHCGGDRNETYAYDYGECECAFGELAKVSGYDG